MNRKKKINFAISYFFGIAQELNDFNDFNSLNDNKKKKKEVFVYFFIGV